MNPFLSAYIQIMFVWWYGWWVGIPFALAALLTMHFKGAFELEIPDYASDAERLALVVAIALTWPFHMRRFSITIGKGKEEG